MRGPKRSLIDAHGRLLGRVSVIDLAAGCLLLSLSPVFYYAYGCAHGFWRVALDQVSPAVVTAGMDRQVDLIGSGFDASMTVEVLGLAARRAHFQSEARLTVDLPPDIGPGLHDVRVRNERGRLLIKDDALQVIWQPTIARVRPQRIPTDEDTVLDIYGEYLEPGCKVSVGRVPNRGVEHVNPTHLRVTVHPDETDAGRREIVITNPSGGRVSLPGGVDVVSAPKQPTGPMTPGQTRQAPQATPMVQAARADDMPIGAGTRGVSARDEGRQAWVASQPVTQEREPVSLFVVCAFTRVLPEIAGRIVPGAMEWEGERPMVRVLHILGRSPMASVRTMPNGATRVVKDSRRRVVIASIQLEGEADVGEPEPKYFYRGKPLHMWTFIDGVRVGGSATSLVVLSDPVPIHGRQGTP